MKKRILFTQLFLSSTLIAQAQLPKTEAQLQTEISRAANVASSVVHAVGEKVEELAKNENVRKLGSLVAEKAGVIKDAAVETAGNIAQAVGKEVEKAKSAVVVTAAQAQHAYKKAQADNAWERKETVEHDVDQVKARISEEDRKLTEEKRRLHAVQEELKRVQKALYERKNLHQQENFVDVVEETAQAAKDTAVNVGKTVSEAVSNAVQAVREKAQGGFQNTKTLIAAAPAKVGSFVQDVRKDHAEHKISDTHKEKAQCEGTLSQRTRDVQAAQQEIDFVRSQITAITKNIADRDRIDSLRRNH